MPIFEYECKLTGEIKEIIGLVTLPNEMACPIHCRPFIEEVDGDFKLNTKLEHPLHNAERIWSAPANIQIGKPTRIFINQRTGKTQVATSEYDKIPFGCIEKELSGPIERSKFEREEQRKLDITNEIVSHQLETTRAETKKNRHADINANISRLAAESDNPSGAESFIRAAMRRKKKAKHGPRKSEVKLAVNHNNSSNMSEAK